jgi:hypothetical protein
MKLYKDEDEQKIAEFLLKESFALFDGAFQAELRTLLWRKTTKAKELLSPGKASK